MTISLARPDVDEMLSLRDWLADEPAIRRAGALRWAPPSDPAAMGDGLDAITLGVTAALSVAQLVVAVGAWRGSRPRRDITVVIEHRDVRVTLQGSDEAQLDRAIKLLADGADPES